MASEEEGGVRESSEAEGRDRQPTPECLTEIKESRTGDSMSLQIRGRSSTGRGLTWTIVVFVLAASALGPLSDACSTPTSAPPETHAYSYRDEDRDHQQLGQRPSARGSWFVLLALLMIPLGVGGHLMWDWRAATIEVTRDRLRVTSRRRFQVALHEVKVEVERISTPDEKERYAVVIGGGGRRRVIRVTTESRSEAEAVAKRLTRVLASSVEHGAYRKTATGASSDA
jgi:hypothetical protein